VQASREKLPGTFQVKYHPPIFVPQQEAPQQSENEDRSARVGNTRKGKSQMVLHLGNMWDVGQI
jgi:hypothetical protein